jgi:hypothetical protein
MKRPTDTPNGGNGKMALSVTEPAVAHNTEAAPRSSTGVKLSKRAQDDLKQKDPAPGKVKEPERTALTANPYTLLLSRIENSAASGAPDRAAVEQLGRFLAIRLAGLGQRAQRQIAALPEFAAAGLSDVAGMAERVRGQLANGAAVGPILALLKHPSFMAHVKDLPRASVYGPRGLVQAS